MAELPVSPLAPARFPDLHVVRGARFATAASGVRYEGRDDVMLAVLDPGTEIAGVFTKSATRAAPVLDCQAKLGNDAPLKETRFDGPVVDGAAILVNAGNANAFTGRNGRDAVNILCDAVREATQIPLHRVFTASTGVIGETLPHDKITAHMAGLTARLDEGGLGKAAHAIRTTDTFAKGSSQVIETEAGPITISGMAKGSGMIAPDMATMLAYIFTDATVSQALLQQLVSRHSETTFNAITVDSDTSTSDTVMVAATGYGPTVTDLSNATGRVFADGLHAIMLDLAHQIVRDGEGATKFVRVSVKGALDAADAKRAAMAIANSPLVKTAIAGEDPNWGRIVMAVGKSGATADRDQLSIHFGDILVAEHGWVASSYTESAGAAYMTHSDIGITVDLGVGSAEFTAWTCDLTHGYIEINADYRS
ncbi:bifunctional glutamate N-acetyltransferase/amino-acid acetyltransferase ArgJ [Actibacterium sp. 188UL27-1]|uniref:bifunctional glutamate N-acetyltransferase/amino-acid acetyltransferase ArgJ n=1 Tax=Actibacterium sp. 188UL27-1 TaxID=2786961 RepID=UPI0019595506|nr:bifunctional glutamate N-acetyltransferase/amino-acid acetyltransferase ArgJ [Actibacterium sp. 188UL27-1]MBM7067041.1 bifunctional glutamate N-acetyltransferase/amino-acid acetyltransferase ArgJ [Actibacterium sp. 188UL27-1]